MEEIIDKFNELVQEMANAVAEAKTQDEADKIQEEYDSRIDKAEVETEAALEEFFKKEQESLEKERLESELIIEEEEIVDEKDEDDSNDDKFIKIKEHYSVKELKAILKAAGIKGYSKLKEDELIKLILDNNLL